MKTTFIKAISLAGGYGGRLNAVTDPQRHAYAIPKAVIPIGARRSIDFGLEAFRKIGLTEVSVATWHLHHLIEQALVSDPGLNISYFQERAKDPLDTASSVASIVRDRGWDARKTNVIIVQSCDIIHNIPLSPALEHHFRTKAAATVVVNAIQWDQADRFGTVLLEGMPRRSEFKSELDFEDAAGAWIIDRQSTGAKILEFREKSSRQTCPSNLNNASIYIFSAAFLRHIMPMMTKKDKDKPLFPDIYRPGGPVPFSDWGRHVFRWLTDPQNRKRFPFFAYITPEKYYWRDIGLGNDIREANMDVLDEKIDGGLDRFAVESWGWRGRDVQIAPSARINRSFIDDGCVIGPGVWIDKAVIGRNTVVEAGAHVYRSVILPKPASEKDPNLIGEGSRLVESLFLGGTINRGTVYERKMIYTPAGGCAIDSLYQKTEII